MVRRFSVVAFALSGAVVACTVLTDLAKLGGDAGADAAPNDAGGDRDGGCGDPATDPRNCGSCGHDCQGGACIGGRCAAIVLVPSTGANKADQGIAVTKDAIYWASFYGDSIVGVRLNELEGGAPKTFASGEPHPTGLIADQGQLYWTTYDDGGVHRAPLDGGAIATYVANLKNPGCFALDSAKAVYVSQFKDGGVVRANGNTIVPVIAGHDGPWGVALDGTHLYWTDYGAGAVWRSDLDGGSAMSISTNEVHAGCLALDATHLYWVTAGDSDAAVAGSVRRWPLDGGPVETFVQLGAELGIAVDDTSVYFSNTGGTQIYRIAK